MSNMESGEFWFQRGLAYIGREGIIAYKLISQTSNIKTWPPMGLWLFHSYVCEGEMLSMIELWKLRDTLGYYNQMDVFLNPYVTLKLQICSINKGQTAQLTKISWKLVSAKTLQILGFNI